MEISPRKTSKRTQEHVDDWLQIQGFFRKHIPRDPTCLFRAVSEQIYFTQYYHIRVRKECVEFMRRKRHLFEKYVSVPYDSYLEQMACFTEPGGMTEIQAMSLLYKREVNLFSGQKQMIRSVTNNGFKECINLCHTPPKQYEAVYTKNVVMAAGFCQSLVYQTLYKNVFGMDNVDNTVHKMLHDRSSSLRHDKFFLKGNLGIRDQLTSEIYKRIENNRNKPEDPPSPIKSSPPFPYRVAKALDSNIYRNIDFDVWHEIRREIKNAGWTRYNSDGLQVGDKCLVEMNFGKNDLDSTNNNISGEENKNRVKAIHKKSNEEPIVFCGHIQEISKNESSVVVYIEELAEKRTVPYSCLKPLSYKKNKQNNGTPIYKRNVQSNESNQKYRRPCNMDTNKARESVNCMNALKASNTERSSDNNKTSNITNNTTSVSTVNITATTITSSIKDNNNIGMKRESFPDHQWKGQSWDNQCQTLEEDISEKSLNYTTNNNISSFHGEGGIHENKSKDSERENIQVISGNPPVYYVSPDGNSYSTVPPYVPGYVGEVIPPNHMNRTLPYLHNSQKFMDSNGCDLQSTDPNTLKFFYNLGLEYYRVNYACNYGPNGSSVPQESCCSTVPPTNLQNPNTSANVEQMHSPGPNVIENKITMEQKETSDNNPHLIQKAIDTSERNVIDTKTDKLPKMEDEKNAASVINDNVKDVTNANKDKRTSNSAPRFKKATSKDRYYNNNEQMYVHQTNFPNQHQNDFTSVEYPNIQNMHIGETQTPRVNTYSNQVHVPQGMPNPYHISYVQQSPYVNVPCCENASEQTYGTQYYLPQGGLPAVTCMTNSDVVDPNNVHTFTPCFYPNTEMYPAPSYPVVYPPYVHPQQPGYSGVAPQNMHDSWFSYPDQHYYAPYGPPVPLPSNEVGQHNNPNLSS